MSNAQLHITDYDTAAVAFGEQVKVPRRYIHLQKSTWLHYDADRDVFEVKYHDTVLVTYYKDGSIRLRSGGFWTGSVLRRLNTYTPDEIGIYSNGRTWDVVYRGTLLHGFYESIVL